jgi:hypothetical protein
MAPAKVTIIKPRAFGNKTSTVRVERRLRQPEFIDGLAGQALSASRGG